MQKQNLNHELDPEGASFATFLKDIPFVPTATTKNQLLYQCGMAAAQAQYRQAKTKSGWLTAGLVFAAIFCGVWAGRLSVNLEQIVVAEQPTPQSTVPNMSLPEKAIINQSPGVLLASTNMEQMQNILANKDLLSLDLINPSNTTPFKIWSVAMSTRELESILPL